MRDPRYQKLLNSKQWRQLRAWYLNEHPLCERCQAKGLVRAAVDVHHKTPVESGRTLGQMKSLCYLATNLQALCIPCHIEVHQNEGSHTKEGHKQRADDQLARWIERHEARRK